MSKPRILVLTPAYPHPGSPSEGIFNHHHARALVAAGARVTVVVVKPWLPETLAQRWRRYRHLRDLPQRHTREGVEILYARYLHLPGYRLPGLTVRSCARAITTALEASNLGRRDFDVVQAHGPWPTGLAAERLNKILGLPLVVTFHIADDERLWRSARSDLYRRMLRRVDALVAVGRPLERFLQEHFADSFEERRLHRIPNGADVEQIREIVRRIADDTRDASGESWGHLVSVCNLWRLKGIDLNLRALATIDERHREEGQGGDREPPWWRYTVVGDGPERPRLEELAKKLGIADRVVFRGRLPHPEAMAAVARADIFTLPSWNEAFGIAYVEAMACGKPVIGCRSQGAEDIVHHGVDGLLVEPRDVESLTDALETLLGDATRARAMGAAAAESSRQRTWERNVDHYLDLYSRVIKSPKEQEEQ